MKESFFLWTLNQLNFKTSYILPGSSRYIIMFVKEEFKNIVGCLQLIFKWCLTQNNHTKYDCKLYTYLCSIYIDIIVWFYIFFLIMKSYYFGAYEFIVKILKTITSSIHKFNCSMKICFMVKKYWKLKQNIYMFYWWKNRLCSIIISYSIIQILK